MKPTLQKRLYEIIESESSDTSFYVNYFIYALIIINIIALSLSTVESLNATYLQLFEMVEHITIAIFTIEYFARLYAVGCRSEYSGRRGFIRYLYSPFHIIDLLSIAPYYLLLFGVNTSYIRTLRLLRIFRLLRMERYIKFGATLKKIFIAKREEFIFILIFTFIIIMIISFIIYEFEHKAQPEVFSSIPQAIWWAVATLTTVGYGDMYPITPEGKFLTSVVVIIGIAFIAIPSGILASSFVEEFEERRSKNKTCRACGAGDITKEQKALVRGEERDISICNNCGYFWGDL